MVGSSHPFAKEMAMLNSPATTIKLINANAVIGFVAKNSNGTGR